LQQNKTGYGLTETSPTAIVLPAEHAARKVGSIGVLLPNLEARLVVDFDGKVDARPAPPRAIKAGTGEEGMGQASEPGELWIRGPNIMKVCAFLFCLFFLVMLMWAVWGRGI
jgi:4-coumarate--CoA ligase